MRFIQQVHETPSVNPRHWAFALTGMVQHPLILSYEDVQQTPSIEIPAAIICAHQPAEHQPDDALIYDAVWRGAAVASLLEEVELDPAVTGATLYAADGYTCTLTLEQLRSAVLATTMNGDPLPVEHGYPARIVVPGLYGFKSPKWIERIHLSDTPLQGTWESRGWTAETLQPFAAIVFPRMSDVIRLNESITFRGIANVSGQQQVQLRINQIALDVTHQPTQARSLIAWSTEWTPTIPGDYRLHVRAGEHEQTRLVRVR